MNEEQKKIIITKFKEIITGGFMTDSDIEDIAESVGISHQETAHFIFSLLAKGTSCEGCKNVDFRFPPSLHPCVNCIRIEKEDYYEAETIA